MGDCEHDQQEDHATHERAERPQDRHGRGTAVAMEVRRTVASRPLRCAPVGEADRPPYITPAYPSPTRMPPHGFVTHVISMERGSDTISRSASPQKVSSRRDRNYSAGLGLCPKGRNQRASVRIVEFDLTCIRPSFSSTTPRRAGRRRHRVRRSSELRRVLNTFYLQWISALMATERTPPSAQVDVWKRVRAQAPRPADAVPERDARSRSANRTTAVAPAKPATPSALPTRA